jgi:hypothetical protein
VEATSTWILGFCEVAAEIDDDSGFLCGGGRDMRHRPVFLWRRQGFAATAGFHAAAPSDLKWRWQVSAVVDVFLLAVTEDHVDVDATCSTQYSSGLIKCIFVASLVEKLL